MYMNDLSSLPFLAVLGPLLFPVLGLAVIWSLVIKGLALWKAARNGHKAWFVFILIVNALGIPELVYLIWFSKESTTTAPAPVPAPSSQLEA